MLKSFVLFDTASSKGRRPNLSLMMLTLTLALVSLISCDIEINSADIKDFLDNNYEKTGNSLNFSDGKWYLLAGLQRNHDRRIFEFHPRKSGYLNYKYLGNVTRQARLESPQQVLVFYDHKSPTIRYSIIDASTFQESEFKEITDYVNELKIQNPQILKTLNQFPYIKVNSKQMLNSTLLYNLLDDVENLLDTDLQDEYRQIYMAEPDEQGLELFMTHIVAFNGGNIF